MGDLERSYFLSAFQFHDVFPFVFALILLEFFLGKLRRYCDGTTDEEMLWTPTGIRNPLAWIVRHCAGLLWLSYGRISGEPVPTSVKASGVAWGALKGAVFEEHEDAPAYPGANASLRDLETAWCTLKEYLGMSRPRGSP